MPDIVLRYSAFGLKIDSELDLMESRQDFDEPADLTIRLGDLSESDIEPASAADFVRIHNVGLFRLRGGSEITADLLPQVRPELLRALIMGRLMGYLFGQRGWLPLHGSAVQVEGGAVLFIGAVGAGKSTTAAVFQARGHRVLSDDVSPVKIVDGVCTLQPGRPRLRLCEDAATAFSSLDPGAQFVVDKYDFRLTSPVPPETVAVKAIYLLESGEKFDIRPVPALEAVTILGRECFIRLRLASPATLASHLRDCAGLINAGIVRKLVRPRDLNLINTLVDLVEHDLALTA